MSAVQAILCPSADELEAYALEGQGPAARGTGEMPGALAEHLASCAACAAVCAQVRDNQRFMDGLLAGLGAAGAARAIGLDGAVPAIGPPPRDLLPGFEIGREIARGGQAAVYEGVQLTTRRKVALKMLAPGEDGPRSQRRLQREAEIAAGLRHPNIVTVYASAVLPDGRCVLAMEYIDGCRLDEWARQVDDAAPPTREGRRAALEQKLRAMISVCDAVQHAHHSGVIHRDLKPANVLVTGEGVPRVLDFGIARRLAAETRITRPGGFAGTLAYASPEQVSGDAESVDTRSDVYALGVMLYELLAQRPPYRTDGSLTGAIGNIVGAEPAPLSTVEPGKQWAGAELSAVVSRALAKDRAERYQTAGALKDDLENWLAGRAVEARSQSGWYLLRKAASRHRGPVSAGLALLVLLAGFGATMAWSARRLDRERSLLAALLSSSTIERARSLSAEGANLRAEALLWEEAVSAWVDLGAPPPGGPSDIAQTQAAWALFELFSRQAGAMAARAPAGSTLVGFEPAGREVHLLGRDGVLERRSVLDGSVLERAARSGDGAMLSVSRRHAVEFGPSAVRVTELASGRVERFEHPGLTGANVIDIAPAGDRMLVLTEESTLSLWSTRPLEEIAVLSRHVSRPASPTFSSDGSMALAGPWREVIAWDARTGVERCRWAFPEDLAARTERWTVPVTVTSPDGATLAVGFGGWILLYDARDPVVPPRRISAHGGFVNGAQFSADSRTLLTTGSERTCKLWDVPTLALINSFELTPTNSGRAVLSGDASHVATCDAMGLLRVFRARPLGCLTRLSAGETTLHSVRWSSDGRSIAGASADGSVRVWDRAGAAPLWSSAPTPVAVTSLAFSPDASTIAGIRTDGTVERWDARTGAVLGELARLSISGTWIGYSPGGDVLAVACHDGVVRLFDPNSGSLVGELQGHTGRVVQVAFHPRGGMLASVGADRVCLVWDLASRSVLRRLVGHESMVRAVAFSPDGREVATGGDDRTIRVWDVRAGACRRIIRDVKQHVFGLAYHPGGAVIFSCCRSPSVQVWDARTGQELAVLTGHSDLVMSIGVAPDGLSLATASADHSAGLWDLAAYAPLLRRNQAVWARRGE